MNKKIVAIFIGPPGSGKGNQAEFLEQKFGFDRLAPGQILRKEIELKTSIGKKVAKKVEKGFLVDDDIVEKLIAKKYQSVGRKIIFDGFPRNASQTVFLHKLLKKTPSVKAVFEFNLPLSKVLDRIKGRYHCLKCGENYHLVYRPSKIPLTCDNCRLKLMKRRDSQSKVVINRRRVYSQLTKPALKYYKNNQDYQYYKIDAAKSISQVSEKVNSIIRTLS